MTTEPRRSLGLLLAATLGVSALLGACAAGQPRIAADLAPVVPANLRQDFESFKQNCSKCHDLERPLTAHVTDVRHWDLYVAKMMRTAGSAISARESPKILRFLYWYTERKEKLANEAKHEKEAVVNGPEPSSEPSSAAPSAPAPATTSNPPSTETVTEPTSGNQGEAAP